MFSAGAQQDTPRGPHMVGNEPPIDSNSILTMRDVSHAVQAGIDDISHDGNACYVSEGSCEPKWRVADLVTLKLRNYTQITPLELPSILCVAAAASVRVKLLHLASPMWMVTDPQVQNFFVHGILWRAGNE